MIDARSETPQEPATAAGRIAATVRRVAVALLSAPLRVYRYAISPMLPPRCRFHPTCSEYAIEALRRHGPLAGSWLAVSRVCRCHPLSHGGVDLVPETFSLRQRGGRWPAALRDEPPARTD